MDVRDSILGTIGNTPLVRLSRVWTKPGVEILAKVEGANPLGSVKERIARAMIEGAERDGTLTKDKTVVESSSGNTGIGMAMVCAVKGYRLLITMSKNVSMERRQLMKALGAEAVLVDGGSDDAWDRADAIAAGDPAKYLRLSQYSSPHNVRIHHETTGPEIWRQTDGCVTHFVATLGTTGTIVGAGRYIKKRNPAIRVISVEPPPQHEQQGLRNMDASRVPPIFDRSVVDERMIVRDADAFRTARDLARSEGILAGISSGTAVWAAMEVGRRLDRGMIVTLLPDRGEKYLSTALFPRD